MSLGASVQQNCHMHLFAEVAHNKRGGADNFAGVLEFDNLVTWLMSMFELAALFVVWAVLDWRVLLLAAGVFLIVLLTRFEIKEEQWDNWEIVGKWVTELEV